MDGRIKLSLGCDFHMYAENIADALANPLRYSIDGKGYLLIEFPDLLDSAAVDGVLRRLRNAGYTLIITHPERNPVAATQSRIAGRVDARRLPCSSNFGGFVRAIRKCAKAFADALLERNWIHFLASDAHHPQWRPLHLKKGYDYVAEKAGEETAHRLYVSNPRAAVGGRQLAGAT